MVGSSKSYGSSECYVSQILTFVESHLIGFDVNNSNFYGPFFGVRGNGQTYKNVAIFEEYVNTGIPTSGVPEQW